MPLIDGDNPLPANSQAHPSAVAPSRQPPFRLSPSLPLLPAKLAAKIQSLQFVELKEFLPDNIKLLKRLEAMDRPSLATLPPNLRPSMREISSLLMWAYCFTQYVAVLAESTPTL